MAGISKPEDAPIESGALEFDDGYTSEDLNQALEQLYSEMGIGEDGEAQVYVSKFIETGKEARIWTGAPDEYNLDKLSKRFGTGDYRVKVYVRHTTGRMVLRGNKIFSILLDPVEEAASRQLANPAQVQATQPQLDMRGLADVILAGIKAAMPQQQQPDPLQQLQGLASVIHTMMPGGVQQQSSAQVNPLSQMRDMIEIINMMKGEREPIEGGVNATGTDVFMRMIDKFGPALAGALTPAQQLAPQMIESPQTIESPQIQSTAAQPQTPENEAMLRLKMGLSFLCSQAEANNDPYTYAQMAIDNVPAEVLTQFATRDDYLSFLAQYTPEVKNHETWFNELRDGIKEILSEDANTDTATPPTTPA